MLNKKRIGLGMMITGGALAIAGAVIFKKSMNDTENEIVDEIVDEVVENYAPYKIEPEVKAETVQANPVEENIIEEPKQQASTYNPMATPVSMSQENLESMGSGTF